MLQSFQLSLIAFLGKKRNQVILLLSLIVVAVLATILAFYAQKTGQSTGPSGSQKQDNTSTATLQNGPKYSIIYGNWDSGVSTISSFNLATQQSSKVATLPFAIKHVSILSPSELLFIDGTNDLDQGLDISVKNIEDNTTKTLFHADSGFKIDSYVLSQNKKYISVWEVSFLPNANSVLGGKSRVYSFEIAKPGTKYLLFDEESELSQPVHYPIAVTNKGGIILDTFVPNTGAGWGYGWSTSNLNGTEKKPIAQLPNGTVSVRPLISPSGSLLLFTGYDGTNGPGTEYIGTFRKSLISPNIIEIYNTDTDTLQKINLPNTNRYSPVNWQISSQGFVYKTVSPNIKDNGIYYYDLETQKSTRIGVPEVSNTYNPAVLTTFTNSKFLIGNQNTNAIDLSNLGSTYAMSLNSVAFIDNGKISEYISLPAAQYIATIKSSYLKKSAAVAEAPPVQIVTTAPDFSSKNGNPQQLQLEAFVFKPNLKDLPGQQTPETCENRPGFNYLEHAECNQCISLAAAACNNMLGTNFTPSSWVDMPLIHPTIKPIVGAPTIDPSQITDKYNAFLACYFKLYIDYSLFLCYDSPLYLYGEKGTKVHVVSGVPLDNSDPIYDPSRGYSAVIDGNGKFFVGKKLYDKISFDYTPAIKKATPPTTGIIISRAQIKEKMTWYAQKMGLNDKETNDVVNAVSDKAKRPYLFISNFPDKTSKKILPLMFTPYPDNYYNIVFYIKQLDTMPPFSVKLPDFESTSKRNGFTAVEISYIVE